jgi:hypothetical protein
MADTPRSCFRADGSPKVRYSRKRDAERAAFWCEGRPVAAYRCPTCKGWHIGATMSEYARERFRRRLMREGRAPSWVR